MPDSVKLERRESVSLVILNRPEVLNAINVAMRETLITLLERRILRWRPPQQSADLSAV